MTDPPDTGDAAQPPASHDGSPASQLRRKIELYRRYLREGVDAALAEIYLRELKDAEAELAALLGEKNTPPD